MQSIIQGSNDPIGLEIEGDVSSFAEISAMIFQGRKLLKEWKTEDVLTIDNVLYFPLKESETLQFPAGLVTLDAKAYTADGRIAFMELVKFSISPRENKHQFTGE